MGFKLKSGNTSSFKQMGSSPVKQKGNIIDYTPPKPKKQVAKKKPVKNTVGEGFMNPPYKYPAGPTEKRKGYHGYKNFDSNIEKKEDAKGLTTNIKKPKVFKDGAKNKVHGVKNPGNWQPHPGAFKKKKSPVEQKDYSLKEWEGEGPTRSFDERGLSGNPPAPREGFTERKLHAKIAERNLKMGKKYKIDKAYKSTGLKPPESPAKQRVSDLPKNFNVKGSSGDTFKKTTKRLVNKATAPKNFNMTGSSKAGKFAKVAKKVVGKGGKFLGGKLLGVAGMMMATSSKADQPKGKKSEGEQIRNLLTKHKLKGGKK